MTKPSSLPANALAARRNPIIGDTTSETLFNTAVVMKFLARAHGIEADALFNAETGGGGGQDGHSSNEIRGLSIVCDVVASALFFELEGRS